MLSTTDTNVLGQIIDTTWGHSSAVKGGGAIKAQILGQHLVVTYHCIATFTSTWVGADQLKLYEEEAVAKVDGEVRVIKTRFRNDAGHALKLKQVSQEPIVDIIGAQPHVSPKRTAHYRYVVRYEIV